MPIHLLHYPIQGQCDCQGNKWMYWDFWRHNSKTALIAQPWLCFMPSSAQDKANHPYLWHSNGAMVPLRKTHINGGATFSSRLQHCKNLRDQNGKLNFSVVKFLWCSYFTWCRIWISGRHWNTKYSNITIINWLLAHRAPLLALPNISKSTTEKFLTNMENTM